MNGHTTRLGSVFMARPGSNVYEVPVAVPRWCAEPKYAAVKFYDARTFGVNYAIPRRNPQQST